MKFDKETIVVFAVCIILIIAWQPICIWMGWAPKPETAQTTTSQVQTVSTSVPVKPLSTVSAAASPSQTNVPAIPEPQVLPPVEIGNADVTLKIDPNNGTVPHLYLKKIFNSDRKTLLDFSAQLQPLPLAVIPAGNWKTVKTASKKTADDQLTLTRILSGPSGMIELTQIWQLSKNYQMKYIVSLRNLGKTQLVLPELEIMSESLEPLEFQAGDTTRSESYGIDYYSNGFATIAGDAKDEKFHIQVNTPVRWLGVQNKYFAGLIKPEQDFAGLKSYRVSKNGNGKSYYIIGAAGIYRNLTFDPNQTRTFNFNCFNGPKELDLLAAFEPQTQQIMHLSFISPMEWISRKLLQFLIYLKDVCGGSYGWAIIVLTIIVRLIFWPVTQKANNSMKKMQKLQPMIQEIREKYKDNQQLMNTKVMELYREQKVNPLGGCLPILLQIPVFIALYSTIDSAVELRHTSFMWAHDLAQPDTVATIMGIGINPLVLAMTALMVLQQRLTPAAADPMQQKMMLLMPVVMLFFLYSLPAGLTLYWTVSQIFSIFQLLINQKLSNDTTTVKPA